MAPAGNCALIPPTSDTTSAFPLTSTAPRSTANTDILLRSGVIGGLFGFTCRDGRTEFWAKKSRWCAKQLHTDGVLFHNWPIFVWKSTPNATDGDNPYPMTRHEPERNLLP